MLLVMDTTMEKDSTPDTINDNDTQQKVEKLLAQITELKSENQKSNEEFGIQRGKMKELFLQKEDELKKLEEEIKRTRDERDEARSQVTIASFDFESRLEEEKAKFAAEISDLHSLVNATLEEASRYEQEISRLRHRNQELESELKSSGTGNVASNAGNITSRESDSVLSAPGAMLSTFARKVVSQLGAVDLPAHHGSSENLEESMRKAKEDAEMLRSLVVPLEEEISALKAKLRETDEQLQSYKAKEQMSAKEIFNSKSSEDLQSANQELGSASGGSIDENKHSNLESETTKGKALACEMCLNYERELVESQRRVSDLEKEVSVMDRLKEELQRESVFRKQMEDKWQESKEHHKQEVTELQQKLEVSESSLSELRKTYFKAKEEISKQFSRLSEERKTTQEKLEKLQLENENLVGKYNSHSQDLQNEEINLPNTVEGLQEMWLAQREELIKARVGLEHSEESVRSLECLYTSSEEKALQLRNQLVVLESERTQFEQEVSRRQSKISQLEHNNAEWRRQAEQLKSIVSSLQADKKKNLRIVRTS
nr:rab GTPase-binding effector protein 1 isoform X2 [Halyomorpha halys]